jgi:hypothetical protein
MKEVESLASLKFDLRLRRRNGWVSDDDVNQNLESLPDRSDRIQVEEAGEQANEPSPSGTSPSGES